METMFTYRYVEGDLVREEAQRISDRHVRSLLRAARLMKGPAVLRLGAPIARNGSRRPEPIGVDSHYRERRPCYC